ncbi:MAG TPA: hypothetical protein VG032_07445 [Acidimicrobiales bacterium]|nr:hypothetical protein [Acidimicrobiales bacterium]
MSPSPPLPPPVPPAVPVATPSTRSVRPPAADSLTIDCADCRHRFTPVCDDCVVSFIVGRQPGDAVVVDAEEARAVRLLEQAGLVPGVRHARQVG